MDEVLRFESSFGANVSAYFEQMRNVTAQGIKIVALPGNHGMPLVPSLWRSNTRYELILMQTLN